MNYIQKVKKTLSKELGFNIEDDLTDMYALLVLIKGQKCTMEDVHDAWAVWKNKELPEHRSLVPFSNLSKKTQRLDKEYSDAIINTSLVINFRLTSNSMKETIETIIKEINKEMPVSCVDDEGKKDIDQCFREILTRNLITNK